MAGRDNIVIGASAGDVEALTQIARALPCGFPANIFVVCHFPTGGTSMRPNLLSRAGPLLATHATDSESFQEKSVLSHQVAAQERAKGAAAVAARFEEQAAQADEYATLIQKHVLNGEGGGNPPEPPTQDTEP